MVRETAVPGPDPLYLDHWVCPECRQGFSRSDGMRGAEWRAHAEDHYRDCLADSAVRLARAAQRSPDRELRSFALARLQDIANAARQGREVVADCGPGSFAMETLIVRMMSDLMEIERRILQSRD